MKKAQEFFPTNPDLVDIVGRIDFDFVNFDFLMFFKEFYGYLMVISGIFCDFG